MLEILKKQIKALQVTQLITAGHQQSYMLTLESSDLLPACLPVFQSVKPVLDLTHGRKLKRN